MEIIICPQCGAKIYGKPFCDYDGNGNLVQLIDFSCTCGYGRIKNPRLKF
jgi:hypothetical protein